MKVGDIWFDQTKRADESKNERWRSEIMILKAGLLSAALFLGVTSVPSMNVQAASLTTYAVGTVNQTDRLRLGQELLDRRERLYRGWDVPNYVLESSCCYGLFDGKFLGYMLANAHNSSYAAFVHHHQGNPGLQDWLSEMESRGEDNAELGALVKTLNLQIKAMENSPIQRDYAPKGVHPDIALSLTVADKVLSLDLGDGRSAPYVNLVAALLSMNLVPEAVDKFVEMKWPTDSRDVYAKLVNIAFAAQKELNQP